jgi:subtilisin family serine protease
MRCGLRSVSLAASLALALLLSACGGGGGGGGNPPTPTSSPSSSPQAGFTCPSSATSFGVASSGSATTSQVRRRFVNYRTSTSAATTSNLLVVTYDTNQLRNGASTLDARLVTYGGKGVGQIYYSRINRASHVVSVDPTRITQAEASLRSQPGVINVQPVQRRYPATDSPYFTSPADPYFYSPSVQSAPLYESATVPGQWDMHIIGLEHAFGYSQSSNGSGITNPGALGSTSVKLAVIDTGMDVTHPDLAKANIVHTACFITDPTNSVQSTGTYVTDPTGHGTDVAGIAGGASGKGFGFEGDAGNVSLMLYRVFPTPDDSCTNPNSTDNRCSASDVDIAAAIEDAVTNGVNVISMSFGGDTCSNGQDPSTAEGSAIADAISHNVIVVAASGNGGTSGVASPGCDPSVIAVGATGYNDGVTNGSGYTATTGEYVASYSQYGSTNTYHSASSWGIVAPGGDPNCPSATTGECSTTGTADDLHWIENIWTSTPFDTNFAGQCDTDAFGQSNDCRILIAGTSMATPHVAGAAALILSAEPSFQSPSAMKQLLCETADQIPATTSQPGCGGLNVYRAMAKAVGDATLP